MTCSLSKLCTFLLNPAQYYIYITLFIARCCTVYCLWRKWDYTECVRGNVNSTDCTVHSAHCCTPSCKLYKLYTALTFSQCALHLSVYTLHWSQIVFMVTLALLTRARYSQKLDHGDLDQMTLGGNRTNIVCMNCESYVYSLYELWIVNRTCIVWMNCEFSMKVKFG